VHVDLLVRFVLIRDFVLPVDLDEVVGRRVDARILQDLHRRELVLSGGLRLTVDCVYDRVHFFLDSVMTLSRFRRSVRMRYCPKRSLIELFV
jgi:hypothetical protein